MTRNNTHHIIACLAAMCLTCMPPAAVFAKPRASTHDLTTQQIAARTLPAIVRLTIRDTSGSPVAFGSGVVVGKNLVATCWHVVNGAHAVTANFSDGRSVSVPGLINADMDHDLALLSVPTGSVKPLAFGAVPPLGAPVVAIGSPEGYSGTVSVGIVSGVRTIELTRVVQTTAPISPGSSGGALLDSKGRVIGIVKAYNVEGQNLNFAVVSDYVKLLFPTDPNSAPTTWDSLASAAGPTDNASTTAPLTASQQNAANDALIGLWNKSDQGWVFTGDVAAVKRALAKGADINAAGKSGNTPLILACATGSYDVADFLVQRGASLTASNDDGMVPLTCAAFNGYADIVKLLLDHGVDKDAVDKIGWTPLMWGAYGGSADVVKLLLYAGVKKDVQSKDTGSTALLLAASEGHANIVKLLLDSGADPEIADHSNAATALMWGAAKGHRDVVQALLDAKANIEAVDQENWTAVIWAAEYGQADIVKQLVDAGAKHASAAKALLDAGTTKDGKDAAVLTASSSGDADAVKVLIDAGADKDTTDKDGNSPLINAAMHGFTDIVKILLDAGANKENTDKDGNTALILAAYNGKADVVKQLLAAGANSSATNKAGANALYYANNPASTVTDDAKAATVDALQAN